MADGGLADRGCVSLSGSRFLIHYPQSTVTTDTPIRAEHESLATYLTEVLGRDGCERVLIVSFSQWAMNSAAVAEMASTLHAMGHQPSVALWADETPMHDVGWTTSHALARLTMSPSRDQHVKTALRRFGLPRDAFPRPPIRRWVPSGALPESQLRYRSAIRELTYRGARVGRAILQVNPDTNTPVTDEHLWPQAWLEAGIESFAWVFDQVTALMTKQRSTAVIVFNGRFLHDSAASEAAEAVGLPVLSFDFGGNDTDFDLTIDATHDWSALQGRMRRMYDTWDPRTRDDVGSSWFEERRQHADPRNTFFTESQTVGVGVDQPDGQRMVVYFSSSGDEISELDLEWGDYFYGQPGALMAVAEACREMDDTQLVVRTHPHKRHKPKRDVEEWHAAVEAARPDIHLDEFSDIDSYTLMRQADVVVTYGSTTGVEAGYARRPVIVMGPSAYDELGCAVRVTTVEDLRRVLADPREGRWQGAVAYGLMMRRRGFVNEHVRLAGDRQMLAGVELRDSRPLVLKLSDVLKTRTWKRLASS